MKIIFTGGSGRFGEVFKKKTNLKNIFFPKKKDFDILNLKQIQKYLSKKKPNILIHAAGLSRPMDIHEKKIDILSKEQLGLGELTENIKDIKFIPRIHTHLEPCKHCGHAMGKHKAHATDPHNHYHISSSFSMEFSPARSLDHHSPGSSPKIPGAGAHGIATIQTARPPLNSLNKK